MRRSGTLLVPVLLGGLLAGCGGATTGTVEDFCADYATFSQGTFFAGVDETDVTSVMSALDAMVKEAKQIRPPEAIEDAWLTVVQESEDHVVAMRGIDWSDEDQQAQYQEFMRDYQSDELDAAVAEVESFVTANCPA